MTPFCALDLFNVIVIKLERNLTLVANMPKVL